MADHTSSVSLTEEAPLKANSTATPTNGATSFNGDAVGEEMPPLPPPPPNKTASLKGMSLNLANSTIGAGIVSLPFAIRECGYVFGAILLVFFGILTNWTLQLLVQATHLLNDSTSAENTRFHKLEEDGAADTNFNGDGPTPPKKSSPHEALEYEEVANEVLGKAGYIIVAICSIMINVGASTGYLVVIGDLILPVIDSIGWQDTFISRREVLVSILSVVFVFPLTLLKNFSSLRWISYISMTGVFAFVVMAVVQLIAEDRTNVTLTPFKFTIDVFLTAPLFTFAYACHTNLLNAYSELQTELRPKMHLVVHGAVGIVFFSYAAVGEIGYITFGENTGRNVINNYPGDSVLVNIIRVIIAISVMFSYPLCSFPSRHSVNMLILLCQGKAHAVREGAISWRRNIFISIPYFLITLGVALVVPDIVSIFGLTGSTSSTLACYILPPLIVMRIKSIYYNERYFTLRNIPLILTFCVGIMLGITSTIVVILDWAATPNE